MPALERVTVAIVGSRGYPVDQMDYHLGPALGGASRVVSGGARGADRKGEEFALALGLSVVSYRPRREVVGPGGREIRFVVERWVDGERKGLVTRKGSTTTDPRAGDPLTFATFGEAAKARNWWIARDCQKMLAFWDGTSTGTAHAIACALRYNRDVRIICDGDS